MVVKLVATRGTSTKLVLLHPAPFWPCLNSCDAASSRPRIPPSAAGEGESFPLCRGCVVRGDNKTLGESGKKPTIEFSSDYTVLSWTEKSWRMQRDQMSHNPAAIYSLPWWNVSIQTGLPLLPMGRGISPKAQGNLLSWPPELMGLERLLTSEHTKSNRQTLAQLLPQHSTLEECHCTWIPSRLKRKVVD